MEPITMTMTATMGKQTGEMEGDVETYRNVYLDDFLMKIWALESTVSRGGSAEIV